MGLFIALLIGIGVGIIIVGISMYIINKVLETKIGRKIKMDLYNNKFLRPIDPKDFDTNMWKDKIDISNSEKELEEFSDKIYKRGKFYIKEDDTKLNEEMIN